MRVRGTEEFTPELAAMGLDPVQGVSLNDNRYCLREIPRPAGKNAGLRNDDI